MHGLIRTTQPELNCLRLGSRELSIAVHLSEYNITCSTSNAGADLTGILPVSVFGSNQCFDDAGQIDRFSHAS